MKKLLPLVLATLTLAGCGAPSLTMPRTATGSVSASSKVGVEKGIMGMFKVNFAKADADKNGFLSIAELPLPQVADPAVDGPDATVARQAAMERLDVNKNGRVTFNEFASKAERAQVVTAFRASMGRLFAQLDANGDRILVESEFPAGNVTIEATDLNKNGKVTLSEFEDGIAAMAAAAPTPVDPAPVDPAPAPVEPTPDAPGDEPAPPADEPTEG